MKKRRISGVEAHEVHALVRHHGLESAVKVKGWLDYRDDESLTTLDPKLRACDRLFLNGCVNLRELPSPLKVDDLHICGCASLEALPNNLWVKELHASRSGLRSLAGLVKLPEHLVLHDCTALTELPDNLHVSSLGLTGCTSLERLPDGLQVASLYMAACTAFTTWGKDGRIVPPYPSFRNRNKRGAKGTGMVILDHCRSLTYLPDWMHTLNYLTLRNCTALTQLPQTLTYVEQIDIGGSGLTERPAYLEYERLLWHGVPVNDTVAWHPEKLHVDDIWQEQNLEVRRIMIDRIGYDRFFAESKAELLDIDEDAGGERKLLRVKLPHGHNRWDRDEPVVCLAVACPSTGRRYMLRVPPHIETCHSGAAWLAGFDDPSLYQPITET